DEITDNPGFAIDSADVYDFDYETGFGTLLGSGGTWGIHALGGSLFTDGQSRLYLMTQLAEIYEMDPETSDLSALLGEGPDTVTSVKGWSGIGGPLTDCVTGFVD
ncbi:MAG: hypothetical protein JRF63_11255, partial [Deltaproteobacteria bacterium]|nr:hypothetical protein [Deltaproteobacteria bacterium]